MRAAGDGHENDQHVPLASRTEELSEHCTAPRAQNLPRTWLCPHRSRVGTSARAALPRTERSEKHPDGVTRRRGAGRVPRLHRAWDALGLKTVFLS